jgi:NADH-quinone oxidoreductase subunit J
MSPIIFYILAGVIVTSALSAVLGKNLFHCALSLAAAMFGISGVFLFLNSEFLAAVQVLIYVGAVTVLIIFGIMLTREVMDGQTKVMNNQFLPSLVAALAVVGIFFAVISLSPIQWNERLVIHHTSTASINGGLATDETAGNTIAQPLNDVYTLGPELLMPQKGFVFAFELVSVLLLSALVGAVVIARKDRT